MSTPSNYCIILFIHSTIILLNIYQMLLHENAIQKFQQTSTELPLCALYVFQPLIFLSYFMISGINKYLSHQLNTKLLNPLNLGFLRFKKQILKRKFVFNHSIVLLLLTRLSHQLTLGNWKTKPKAIRQVSLLWSNACHNFSSKILAFYRLGFQI